MNNSAVATFALKTCNASSSGTNNISFTWNNIDLRTLLGHMYLQYDVFNLELIEIATTVCNGSLGTSTAVDLSLYLEMTGLPFVNQGYDDRTNLNNNKAIIGSLTLIRSTSYQKQYYDNFITFRKHQELANISIALKRISDNAIPATSQAFPSMIFIFKVTGVDIENKLIDDSFSNDMRQTAPNPQPQKNNPYYIK